MQWGNVAQWVGVVVTSAAVMVALFNEDTGVISGTVSDAESGGATRKAGVTLTLEGTPRRWTTTRIDGSGRFQFEGLPAGKYDLRAAKADENGNSWRK